MSAVLKKAVKLNHSLTHLAPNRRQAIIWTNTDPIHWRLYAALVGDGLMPFNFPYPLWLI